MGFLHFTYFGWAQQLWQVVVGNHKEAAAAHLLQQQNKCWPCPTDFSPRASAHTAPRVSSERAAAFIIQILIALTQFGSKWHILQAMQNSEGSFTSVKVIMNQPDSQGKNLGTFLEYVPYPPPEVSCQLLLILSLKSPFIHSLSSLLPA